MKKRKAFKRLEKNEDLKGLVFFPTVCSSPTVMEDSLCSSPTVMEDSFNRRYYFSSSSFSRGFGLGADSPKISPFAS